MKLSQFNVMPTPIERTLGIPPGGPKFLPLSLDFSQAADFTLDYQNMQARDFLNMCQTLWVDNSLNTGDEIWINIPLSDQTIKVPAGVQGYFTCICPNPIRMIFTCTGTAIVKVSLLNFPVWS